MMKSKTVRKTPAHLLAAGMVALAAVAVGETTFTAAVHDGYNYSGVKIAVAVAACDTANAAIRLTVNDAAGSQVGDIRKTAITGAGSYSLPVADLAKGADYTFKVAIVDGSDNVIAAEQTLARTLGAVNGSPLFSADATAGESVVKNGAWVESAPTVANNAYQLNADAAFAVSEKLSGGRIDTLDFDVTFQDGDDAVDATGTHQAGLTVNDGKWQVWDGEKLVDTGVAAAPNTPYVVRLVLNRTARTVRYLVSNDQGANFTTLSANGTTDFPNGKQDATAVDRVAFTGESALAQMAATTEVVNTNLVKVEGGEEYATLEAAIAAGKPINLLTNVKVDTAKVAAGSYTVNAGDNKLRWLDATDKIGAFDGETFIVKEGSPKNGLDSYTSYALQLDPEKASDKPFLKPVNGATTDKLAFKCYRGENQELAAREGEVVTYQVEHSSSPDFATTSGVTAKAKVGETALAELPTAAASDNVRYYRVKFEVE